MTGGRWGKEIYWSKPTGGGIWWAAVIAMETGVGKGLGGSTWAPIFLFNRNISPMMSVSDQSIYHFMMKCISLFRLSFSIFRSGKLWQWQHHLTPLDPPEIHKLTVCPLLQTRLHHWDSSQHCIWTRPTHTPPSRAKDPDGRADNLTQIQLIFFLLPPILCLRQVISFPPACRRFWSFSPRGLSHGYMVMSL